MIAARAVLLKEVQSHLFKTYASQVLNIAKALEKGLLRHKVRLVSGGTSTHLVLVDTISSGKTGDLIENLLLKADVLSNRNPIPFDVGYSNSNGGPRLGRQFVCLGRDVVLTDEFRQICC